MPKYYEEIPPIRGNPLIVEKRENPDNIMYENVLGQTGGKQAAKKRQKSGKRIQFTPNKHTLGIIGQVREKYGRRGVSEFINAAIEKEGKKRV